MSEYTARLMAEAQALTDEAREHARRLPDDDRRLLALVDEGTRGRTRLTIEELAELAVGQLGDVHTSLGRLTSYPQLLTDTEDLAPAGHKYALNVRGVRVLAALEELDRDHAGAPVQS